MAGKFNGLTVTVTGSDNWWTQSGYTGDRYTATGSQAVFSYANGAISVAISYRLENKGTWDEVYGGTQ